jgi:hypothetical protein
MDMDSTAYSPSTTRLELSTAYTRGRWFRAPYRLLIVHTALILVFMLTLYVGWTDFTPQPYDCVYLPYLVASGPIVYGVGHVAMHHVDRLISVDDTATTRIAWNLIPGGVCLLLGGMQYWLIESAYIWLRQRSSGVPIR